MVPSKAAGKTGTAAPLAGVGSERATCLLPCTQRAALKLTWPELLQGERSGDPGPMLSFVKNDQKALHQWSSSSSPLSNLCYA